MHAYVRIYFRAGYNEADFAQWELSAVEPGERGTYTRTSPTCAWISSIQLRGLARISVSSTNAASLRDVVLLKWICNHFVIPRTKCTACNIDRNHNFTLPFPFFKAFYHSREFSSLIFRATYYTAKCRISMNLAGKIHQSNVYNVTVVIQTLLMQQRWTLIYILKHNISR